MSSNEVLWMITQERGRQAAQAARERSAMSARRPPGGSLTGLLGRLRRRIEDRNREPLRPIQNAPGR